MKEDSYNTHKQLLLHTEYANKPNQNSEPIYLHVAHQQELKEALSQSQSILGKLGRFAALINQMTVQSLVTVVQKAVTSFHTNLCKVTGTFLFVPLCITAQLLLPSFFFLKKKEEASVV